MQPKLFFPGDWVEVRHFSEIAATLDAKGTFDGLPFMPEMVSYCNRRFRVYRRAERVFVDRYGFVTPLKNTVFLEGVRCNGKSHDGCQAECMMFWKEAWLRPAAQTPPHPDSAPCDTSHLRTTQDGRYRCQATELARSGVKLSWWDIRQYFHDYRSRNMTASEWLRMMTTLAQNKLRRAIGLKEAGGTPGSSKKTPIETLGLQPGELVEVKSLDEIRATLDSLGRNRGLGFTSEMAQCCNRRFHVLHRVERMILEWSGEMRELANTVVLNESTCTGLERRGCPRNCHQLWRECWLRRVP